MDDKTALRLAMRRLRRDAAAKDPDAGRRAVALVSEASLPPARVIAAYRPQGAEIDPAPLVGRLAPPALVSMPVAQPDGSLIFRAWRPGARLAQDAAGISAPTADADIAWPDLVIVPLLAFDRQGGRLGQGGGYYDRALRDLRARGQVFALGLAYAAQEVAAVPREPHDQRLDAILTETGFIRVVTEPG